MYEVRFVLKSGNHVVVEYTDSEEVEDLSEMFMDPHCVQFELEDDTSRTFIPKDNIDFIEVKDVQ